MLPDSSSEFMTSVVSVVMATNCVILCSVGKYSPGTLQSFFLILRHLNLSTLSTSLFLLMSCSNFYRQQVIYSSSYYTISKCSEFGLFSLHFYTMHLYQYIYIYYFENISFFFVFDISISPSSFPHLVFTQRKTISGVHMFIFPYCPVLSNKLFLNANKFLGILKIQKELPMAVFQ